MRIKVGKSFRDNNSGRVITITRRASGNGHWQCQAGKKTHQIHEGTLKKFYSPVE